MADIILLFADIVPETVVKLLIVKLFVIVFAETIKLFVVVVPDVFFWKNLALSYQNKEKHRFSKRMWPSGKKKKHTHTSKVSSVILSLYILYNPFKLFIVI